MIDQFYLIYVKKRPTLYPLKHNKIRPIIRILFCYTLLSLVYFVDILSVDNLHSRNSLIAGRAIDVGTLLRVIIYEYAGIVFCYAVPMNLQQPSSRSFFIFQELLSAPTINCKNPVFGPLLQQGSLSSFASASIRFKLTC